MKVSSLSIWGLSAVALSAGIAQKSKPEKIDFNRDVRPILAAKCFACHGNDPKAIRAGLNLNIRDGATKLLDDHTRAIDPGHPDKSELISRIFSKSADTVMPPPDTNKSLTDDEKQVLKRWISEGAEYKPHWAFVPPVRPKLPTVRTKGWVRNEIDRFVLAKLESKGMRPAPEADRNTLLRRVSLDLIGLPPTAEEVSSFVNDKSPNAYEKVVDRLLASPRFGERMAMDWIDYSRYADSNGYQADYERFQWRWRDWVINAFNQNKPFDQFTVEQLAGDLLPHPTLDQKIATGFNRNHRINTEGGVIVEEWRVETVIDRVETTTATWLGLTAGCARCHDHKYDPLTQKEFYSLYSYFNNVSETGSGEERPVNHPPFIQAPSPDYAPKLAALDSKIKNTVARLTQRATQNEAVAANWKLDSAAETSHLKEGLASHIEFSGTGAIGDATKTVGNVRFVPGHKGNAATVDGDNYLDAGKVGDFDAAKPFSYAAWVYPEEGFGAPLSRMDTPANNYRGWDLFMSDAKPAVHLIDSWPSDALKVASRTAVPLKKWSHIAVSYDGSRTPQGISIYINGQKVETNVETNQLKGNIHANVSTKIGTRTGSSGFRGMIESVYLYNRALGATEAALLAESHPAKDLIAIPVEKRTPSQKLELARIWSGENDTTYQSLAEEQRKLQSQRDQLVASVPTVMVMDEMKTPRPAYVLIRGQYDKYGDKVGPAIPAALGALPAGVPNNRLGLAKWIVSPKNPLTARVTVNRLWERFFGIGIVQTSEDFGTRADFPSHPELLDWLAVDFVEGGWNTKALLKKIAMSATYRQSSKVSPWLAANDPANRLLARGPRFRLPAEVIRDQALAVSGLLAEKIGGPSVRPYQPEGLWDETAKFGNLLHYKPDQGQGLYRRSLYTFWKRTAAPPNMTLFDVPSREICRIRRGRTNTPLQALTLLNDTTYLEASRVLAQRMLRSGSSTPDRVRFAFRTVVGREPRADETQLLSAGLNRRVRQYRQNPKAANELLKVGDAPIDKGLEPAEVAAYTITASTLLNLDETITKE